MNAPRITWLAALALAVTALTASGTVAMAEPVPNNDHDLAAFERILRQQEEAWAAEDGAAFAATFAKDADFVAFNGDYLVTREGIATGMQHAFDNYIEPSRIVRLDAHVRFIEPDLAIIVRKSCIIPDGQDACRSGSHSRNTNVLHRQHGEWLQTSFQNTRIDPLPASSTSR